MPGRRKKTGYQEPFRCGAVTDCTPKVQYGYSKMAGGANHSRLVSLTYPNGRVLNYSYTNAGGLDDKISRLSALKDGSLVLESFSYLGLGTVVTRAHPEPGVNLTYIQSGGSGDGGDQYVGLDRFGRVLDQRWQRTRDSTYTDRFRYGYDRDGNRLYRENLQSSDPKHVSRSFSELYHASGAVNDLDRYDPLGQLTAFSRGVLSDANRDGVPDTVASPTRSQSWVFDGLGNWSTFTTDQMDQGRTHNQQNQITSIAGRTTPSYDSNGNTTRDESNRILRYDAWNRLAGVEDSRGTPLAGYGYDALNRQVTEGPTGAALELYYSAAWQVLEERAAGATLAQSQYVWSPVYVDALVLRDRGTERLYAQQEANWNVTALVDSAGNVVERYVEDPYGGVIVLTEGWAVRGSGSQYAWVYLHQGGRFETVSALYHFRNRDLSPLLGRWIQQDLVGYSAGMNLYAYLSGSPSSWVDPLGLREVDCRACGNCKGKKDAKDIVDKLIKDQIDELKKQNTKSADLPQALYKKFGTGLYVTEIEDWISKQKDHYAAPDPNAPSKYTGSGLEKTLAGCVLLCGECVGIDKLGHMFQQGWQYYQISVIDNKGNAAAEKFGQYTEGVGKASDYTKEEQSYYNGILGKVLGFIGFGVYGKTTSGVISNADLASNKAGLQFYKDVAAGKFKSICDYVTKDWDEEKNPNEYTDKLKQIVIVNTLKGVWIPSWF